MKGRSAIFNIFLINFVDNFHVDGKIILSFFGESPWVFVSDRRFSLRGQHEKNTTRTNTSIPFTLTPSDETSRSDCLYAGFLSFERRGGKI